MKKLPTNETIDKYLRVLKYNLVCKRQRKKQIIKEISEEIMYFCADRNYSYIEICERFGMPEKIAKELSGNQCIVIKRRQIATGFLSILLTLCVIASGLVIQDVGFINNLFFPMVTASVFPSEDKTKWTKVSFEDKEYIRFNSFLWEKRIIIAAGSNWSNDLVHMRIKDESGSIVLDDFIIESGVGIDLDTLKYDEKYYVEVQSPPDMISINVV